MRLLTTLVIVGLCGFALLRGWQVATFAVAQASAPSTVAAKAADLLEWQDVPGVANRAIKASLALTASVASPIEAQRRADGLARLLALRPLASGDWLSLAG